jgi:hypothetical protein
MHTRSVSALRATPGTSHDPAHHPSRRVLNVRGTSHPDCAVRASEERVNMDAPGAHPRQYTVLPPLPPRQSCTREGDRRGSGPPATRGYGRWVRRALRTLTTVDVPFPCPSLHMRALTRRRRGGGAVRSTRARHTVARGGSAVKVVARAPPTLRPRARTAAAVVVAAGGSLMLSTHTAGAAELMLDHNSAMQACHRTRPIPETSTPAPTARNTSASVQPRLGAGLRGRDTLR